MPIEVRTPLRLTAAALSIALLNPQLVAFAQIPAPPPNPPAQTSSQPPVPAQIAAARTIYLTNAGGDPNFPIDQHRAYSDIYAALQSWGRYKLVNSADQADLVLALNDVSPITDVVGDYDSGTYSIHTPAFQLTLLDGHTNQPIWTITSPVMVTGKGKTEARWVSLSVTNLVSRFKVLAGDPLTTAESDDLTTYPRSHYGLKVGLIAGSMMVLGVGGGILLHHEYENSLADMKNQADAWCQANHIPMNECPGG
jgi:hypothetical protein